MKRPARQRSCCCAGCGAVLLLLAIVGILFLMPPPRPRAPSPAERVEAGRRARALRQEVLSITRDAREGRARDFRLEIREGDVNEMLQSDPDFVRKLQRVELSDPYVVIEDGRVRLTATRSVAGIGVPTTVSFRPGIDADGRIAVALETAEAGRLKLPGRITQRLADRLEQDLMRKVNDGPVRLRSLRAEHGGVVVEGSTR